MKWIVGIGIVIILVITYALCKSASIMSRAEEEYYEHIKKD